MTDQISTTNASADTCVSDAQHTVDDTVRELGFKPVRAWIPDVKKKADTVGAKRTRRCREHAEQLGLKQLSVTLPVELHPKLKTLAARTKNGESPEAVLAELYPSLCESHKDTGDNNSDSSNRWINTLPAWRRCLVRWLLPSEILNR